MIREMIDRIIQLGEIPKIEINGRCYIKDGGGQLSLVNAPLPETLKTCTLSSIKSYLTSNYSTIGDELAIHIENPYTVKIVDRIDAVSGSMPVYLEANAPMTRFAFDRFINAEEFIIAARQFFKPNEDLKSMLESVSKIKIKDDAAIEDNGYTQKVSASKGVHLVSNIELPPELNLCRYIGWPEIDAVDSKFMIRIKGGRSDGPMVALFDLDPEQWRINTMQEVEKYLEMLDIKVPIIC